MTERKLSGDHVTIWRWVQRYAPILNQRIRGEMRRPNRSGGLTKPHQGRGELGLPVSRRRLRWRDHRVHVVVGNSFRLAPPDPAAPALRAIMPTR
jgi:hypothetical protein